MWMTYAIGSKSRIALIAVSKAGAMTFSSSGVSEDVKRMFTAGLQASVVPFAVLAELRICQSIVFHWRDSRLPSRHYSVSQESYGSVKTKL